jgi:hypothetical protein
MLIRNILTQYSDDGKSLEKVNAGRGLSCILAGKIYQFNKLILAFNNFSLRGGLLVVMFLHYHPYEMNSAEVFSIDHIFIRKGKCEKKDIAFLSNKGGNYYEKDIPYYHSGAFVDKPQCICR